MKNKEIEEVKNAITDWFADNITIEGRNAVLVRYGMPYIAMYYSSCNTFRDWLNSEYNPLTNFEKEVLTNVDSESKWIARDLNGALFLYDRKPYKLKNGTSNQWTIGLSGNRCYLPLKDNFKSIQWSDSEPVRIDDYVTRVGYARHE